MKRRKDASGGTDTENWLIRGVSAYKGCGPRQEVNADSRAVFLNW